MKISRRNFVKASGIGLAGFPFLANSLTQAAPSDRISVAHIGAGGQ